MSPELIAILAIGVALAGLTLRGQHGLGARMDRHESRLDARMDGLEARLDARMDGLEARFDARMDGLEARLDARMDGLEAELREIRDRLSRLEGKVDFLESYIVRRNEAGAPAE